MEAMFERLTNSTLRSRIVERKLAAQFGASLAVVREAIIQLEAEGFITKWPNTSTHVTRLSLAETEKIFAVRKVLEAFAVEEAARLATSQDIESLQKLFLE